MKLTYVYHSGFILEGKDFTLLIDYYRDTPDEVVHEKFLNRPGKLYVLASHVHADHFNPEILTWIFNIFFQQIYGLQTYPVFPASFI